MSSPNKRGKSRGGRGGRWRAARDLPDVHTPAMILNSLMFGFTVQVLVSQNPENLAKLDFLYAEQARESGQGQYLISYDIVDYGGRTAGKTIVALLVSMFTVLLRYVLEIISLHQRGWILTTFIALDLGGAIAVTLLTMNNLGDFLVLVTKGIHACMPPYRLPQDWTRKSLEEHLASIPAFDENDPFALSVSVNGTGSVFALTEFAYRWLIFNSTVYIILGCVFAVVAFSPLFGKMYYLCMNRWGKKYCCRPCLPYQDESIKATDTSMQANTAVVADGPA